MIILGWVLLNHVAAFLRTSYHGLLDGKGLDPAPLILLNLVCAAGRVLHRCAPAA